MNAALFRKELRDLLPWGALGLAVGLSSVAEILLRQIDLAPLGQTFRLLHQYNVGLYWLIAFAIGTSLAIREHDDRTLAFLDGLPVSRSRVFLVKCAVMSLLVMIAPVLEVVALGAMHLLSRGSLDRELHVPLLLQALALQWLLLVNGLLLGAAFGRLRSLTWAAAGLSATALLFLIERVPRAAALNPLTLLEWQWTDVAIVVDAETLRIQLAVSALAGFIAWRGFVYAGRGRRTFSPSGPVIGAAVVAATVTAIATAFFVLVRPLSDSLAAAEQRAAGGSFQFAPSPPAQTLTRHYRISYPSHEAAAALALAGGADAVFERVHTLLGLPLGGAIDVDASGSARNTHGTAFFGRVRMQIDSEALAVLAHETAHVVAQRAAGAERDWLWQEAAVLSEGLASWVETPFRARAERTDERMLVLAAMHERRELVVEELASPGRFQSLRDENVKYAAGEAFIGALVRLHGEEALPRLLRAFDDPRLPFDLRGMSLWQSTFQLAGFDLAAVVDEFYRGIEAYAALHAERIAALPRPRVVLVRLGRTIGAMAVLDSVDGEQAAQHRFAVRFRPAPDSPYSEYRQFATVADQPVWPQSRDVRGGRLCVQAGVSVGAEILFEPWTCLPTNEAVDFGVPRRGRDGANGAVP